MIIFNLNDKKINSYRENDGESKNHNSVNVPKPAEFLLPIPV